MGQRYKGAIERNGSRNGWNIIIAESTNQIEIIKIARSICSKNNITLVRTSIYMEKVL